MPAGILQNVNVMIYLKFKLQLKSRNTKNYSSIILNFPPRFMLKNTST